MVQFMDLPREVRDMVYEYALCIDGVLAPYKEPYTIDEDYEGSLPNLALLATSHKVRDETLPIFFGKNTWRVSSRAKVMSAATIPSYCPIFQSTPALTKGFWQETGNETLFTRYAKLFRKVVLHYSHQEAGDRIDIFNAVHDPANGIATNKQETEVHQRSIRAMLKCWVPKHVLVLGMTELTSVTINVKNLYCPVGCCRENALGLALMALETYANVFTIMKKPYVEITGSKTEQEASLFKKWRQKRLTEHENAQRAVVLTNA